MTNTNDPEILRGRKAPIEIDPEEFREIGRRLVDQIADHLAGLRAGPVRREETPQQIRKLLKADERLPEAGTSPGPLLDETATMLFEHSLFNGHPRFGGYITASAAPLGVLGDLLAAAVNPNVGGWQLSPVATEIESQTVRWIAELIGYPNNCGGLLVSGGNMANFVGFLAARRAKADWDVRQSGMAGTKAKRLRAYVSKETHTWVEKAADLFGLGTGAIRWIATDTEQRLDVNALRTQIELDRKQGEQPFLVVGTAGSVSTGAVDPLPEIAAVCREYGLWFHVDGAYGAIAAAVEEAPDALRGLSEADSVAVDPHKWLYAPLEAGCALVRDPKNLLDAFSYHPPYYHFDHEAVNYFEHGPQNSRGFRALKVWLALQQAGRQGYQCMITDDIRLARQLHALLGEQKDFETLTQNLSIVTFRYVPTDLRAEATRAKVAAYLNRLNEELLTRLNRGGEAFLSNAVIEGTFALRLCIVNFRTSLEDMEALPPLVARLGRETDAALRREAFEGS